MCVTEEYEALVAALFACFSEKLKTYRDFLETTLFSFMCHYKKQMFLPFLTLVTTTEELIRTLFLFS